MSQITEQDIKDILEAVDDDTCVGWTATSMVTVLARFVAKQIGTKQYLLAEFKRFVQEQAKEELSREKDDALEDDDDEADDDDEYEDWGFEDEFDDDSFDNDDDVTGFDSDDERL